MDFDFLSFLLGIIVGLGIAYCIVYVLGRAIYNRLLATVEEEVVKEVDTQRINLKVEKHGNLLYAFREDNDGFVCQGADFNELKQEFVKRFPNKVGAIVGNTDELHNELIEQRKKMLNESSSSV